MKTVSSTDEERINGVFGRTIFGLTAKGEQVGLMRRMVSEWFDCYTELLNAIEEFGALPI